MLVLFFEYIWATKVECNSTWYFNLEHISLLLSWIQIGIQSTNNTFNSRSTNLILHPCIGLLFV